MRNITDVKVVQTYLFKPDTFPFAHLNNKIFVDAVMLQFGFQSHNLLLVQGGVGPGFDFFSGVLRNDKTSLVPFEQFRVEPLRLSFVVVGESKQVQYAFEQVSNIVKSIVPAFSSEIDVIGEQSSCAVSLDVPFASLINPQFLSFLKDTVEEGASKQGNTAVVEPRGFKANIRVSKKDAPDVFADHTLTIEPRIGTKLNENRYYVSAPTDSDNLLKLLEEFEQIFKPEKR